MSTSHEPTLPQAAQHLRRLLITKRLARVLSIAVLFAFYSVGASAAITVNSIDESRVSAVEGLSTGSTNITIFGGIAGNACTGANGVDDTVTTCSSCRQTPGGDSSLRPCNDRRINPNLILSLSITSSDHDGYPNIATSTTTTTTGGAAAGTVLRGTSATLPSLVSKTKAGQINIPWSAICPNLALTGGGGSFASNQCDVTASDGATATFQVGMTATQSPSTTATTDDMATITITLHKGEAASSSLATSGVGGITYFEINSGDNKGSLTKLKSAGNGFPVGTHINYRWVRVLFEQRDDAQKNKPSGSVWTTINPGSPHVDLQIQSSATDVSNLNLSPITIMSGDGHKMDGTAYSVGVTNDHVYDTKIAVVDQARNVAFYTPAANDDDCETADGTPHNPASFSPVTGIYECHTIRPALVVGILSNKVNCFIATASYGSPMSREVDTFRGFRDRFLIPTKLGLKFVRWYYSEGPKYANFIRQSETYRAFARGLLWLPLQFAKVSLGYGIFAGIVFLLTSLLAPFVLLIVAIRNVRRHRGSLSLNA